MKYKNVMIAAFGNMMGTLFQIGYGLGVMNSLIYDLKTVFERNPCSATNDFITAQSLTTGLWALGGAIGSQIGGLLGPKLGRKNSLLINNVFIISGLLLQVRIKNLILSFAVACEVFQIVKFQFSA